jgi:acetolactate synthase-1/2/3 large subunit
MAENERPGAVHLELPEDVAHEEVPGGRPLRRVRLRRPVPDEKAIEGAVEMIRAARNPILIVSAGANRKRIGKQLRQFVEKTGIYAVTTQMGKGVIPDDHPRSLFSLGIHKKDWVHVAVETADLVITVGYNIVEYPPSVWNETKDKRILHIDFSIAEPDEFYSPDLEVVGDISYSLWAIHSRIGGPDDEGAEEATPLFDNPELAALRAFIDEKLHRPAGGDGYPPKPQRIVREVRGVMGPTDVVCLDNGIYKLWFARMYETYAENTVLLDNALATMGAGLASAMAAKMVHPDRRVMAISGDGGFMMNSQDLETAVRLGLGIVVLVLRDDAYGFIRWKQRGMGFPDFGMALGNPDFVKYAEAYGAGGLRVGEGDRLATVLEAAFTTAGETGRPVLVDCPIDYAENAALARDLTAEVRHLVTG